MHGFAQFVEQSQAVQPFCRVGVVDRDVEEEGVDGGAQGGQGAHRALEILLVEALADRHAGRGHGVGEVDLRDRGEGRVNMLVGEGAGAVLLFLGAQDVGGAAIADEQVPAVLGIEQAPSASTRRTIRRRSS